MTPVRARPRRAGDSGQALVEAALALPLTVFLILGAIQLFMLEQGRIMAQYGVMRAARAGSLNFGDCRPMMDAAIASVMPAVTAVYDPKNPTADLFSKEFLKRRSDTYQVPGPNGQTFNGQIIEMVRERPSPTLDASRLAGGEDVDFDDPDRGPSLNLEVRMVFWDKMNIPFANWVISKMLLAHFGIQSFTGTNPIFPVQKAASWTAAPGANLDPTGGWPGGSLASTMQTWSQQGSYLFPIQVNAAMRMMTPTKVANLNHACPMFKGN